MGFVERLDERIDKGIDEMLAQSKGWDRHPEANKYRKEAFLHLVKMDIGLLATMLATSIHPAAFVLALEPLRQSTLTLINSAKVSRKLKEGKNTPAVNKAIPQ